MTIKQQNKSNVLSVLKALSFSRWHSWCGMMGETTSVIINCINARLRLEITAVNRNDVTLPMVLFKGSVIGGDCDCDWCSHWPFLTRLMICGHIHSCSPASPSRVRRSTCDSFTAETKSFCEHHLANEISRCGSLCTTRFLLNSFSLTVCVFWLFNAFPFIYSDTLMQGSECAVIHQLTISPHSGICLCRVRNSLQHSRWRDVWCNYVTLTRRTRHQWVRLQRECHTLMFPNRKYSCKQNHSRPEKKIENTKLIGSLHHDYTCATHLFC